MSLRESRLARPYRSRLMPALLVIAVGVFFLLDNLGFDVALLNQHNWWAWLILVVALSPLFDAVQRYRVTGAIDGPVLHSLLNAGAMVLVALMFILELSWHRWWPVFIIYGGLCMLVRGRRTPPDETLR